MFKPKNWDDIKPLYYGEARPMPPAGAYVCKIVSATKFTSSAGKESVALDLDIAEGIYKDYYQSEYDRATDNGWERRWRLKMYQSIEASQLAFFKGLIVNVEVSNPYFKYNFQESSLAGKLIGVILDLEEYEYNGKVNTRLKPGRTYTIEQVRQGLTRAAVRIGLDRQRHKLGERSETTTEPKAESKAVTKAAELEPVDDIDIPF